MMDGKPGTPPNFALLIGKRLAGKKGGADDGGPAGEGPPEGEGEDQQHDMCISAMSDFIDAVHAKDPEAAHSALGDYMQLEEKEETPEEESAEESPAEEEPAA